MQLTTDGGVTWTSVAFDGADVRQLLSLDYVSESQIDVIAATADCTPTVVTSFTGGEFWQAYPDQIESVTFLQPTDPTVLRVQGADVTAPCAVREVRSVSQSLAVLCSDGSVQVRGKTALWTQLNTSDVLAMAPNGATGVLVVSSVPTCTGVLVRSIDIDSGASTDLSCLAARRTNATVDLMANSVFYWSGADFLLSETGGTSWAPVGR
ncbi:hypothetical protein ACFJGV_06330 [Cnuibacter sp. UC19_7]|uniref:hypothetical protein n=1 Tax=Cnuibacter sp. UC19_7 TaxID=3350166 RepID=UPI00366AC104